MSAYEPGFWGDLWYEVFPEDRPSDQPDEPPDPPPAAPDSKVSYERFLELLADRDHQIQFSDDGWIIAHPLYERLDGSLFDCTMRWHGDPGVRGRFWLHGDGSLCGRIEG